MVLFSACAMSSAYAQVEMIKGLSSLHGVNNDGLVVGTPSQNTPFYLWNPADGSVEKIGGISAGEGVGGVASFTDDGKTIAANTYIDTVKLAAEWKKVDVGEEYIITDLLYYNEYYSYAIAKTADNDECLFFDGANGQRWSPYNPESDIDKNGVKGGLLCMCGTKTYKVFVGGYNGAAYVNNVGGRYFTAIDPRPAGNESEVKAYWAVDFNDDAMSAAGVYGAELSDGSAAVWQTSDNGQTFNETTGVLGVPKNITHIGDVFYLVTANGYIQKSEDKGLTWTEIYHVDGGTQLFDICFMDSNTGIATAEDCIYRTEDGGTSWTRVDVGAGVSPCGEGEMSGWLSVACNSDRFVISGSAAAIYESVDKGVTWKKMEIEGVDGNTNLCALDISDKYIYVGCDLGSIYSRSAVEFGSGAVAALYDIDSKTWSPLETFGFIGDRSASSAYNISGDGKTVLGNSNVEDAMGIISHATAWSADEGIIDLGSKFVGEYTRAAASSYDGSVIVGHQDKLGPWHAVIWKKNPDGGYYGPQYIFAEEGLTDEDVNFDSMSDMCSKILREARCVSSDGKWVGGRGDGSGVVPCPWIWSEETGVIKIGNEESAGYVMDMNNDASVLVGNLGSGESGWIWTEEMGQVDLNVFVEKYLGYELEDCTLCGPYDMSPNGRYIVGYGMDSNMETFGYRIDLKDWLSVRETETGKCEAAVYPNPVSDELHVDFLDNAESVIRLYDMQGRLVLETRRSDMNNVVSISDVEEGLYVLDVTFDGMRRTFKIEINH